MSTPPTVVPNPHRCADLKQILSKFADQITAIRHAHSERYSDQSFLFIYLCFPWIADRTQLTSEQLQQSAEREQEAAALAFDGVAARVDLQHILDTDKHLFQCCKNLWLLAQYLDTTFIQPFSVARRRGLVGAEQFEFLFREFEITTYEQGPYRRIAVSHLYNFEIDVPSVIFESSPSPFGRITIERVNPNAIPQILGEPGFRSFLHPAGIGNCFIVDEGGTELDDMKWLISKRFNARYFCETLQYLKDGIVHLGYSAIAFQPNWVNHLRRGGLFYLGTPRQLPYSAGNKLYRLDGDERERFRKWWLAATTEQVFIALDKKVGKLKEALTRAGQYYSTSHEKDSVAERLLSLAICVESLFSRSGGEIRFRLASSMANFIGNDAPERKRIYRDIKAMYDKRSALAHGNYDYADYEAGKFVTEEELDRWASLVRRALVGVVAQYLREPKLTRDELLKEIEDSALDNELREDLRQRSDIESLVSSVLEHGVIR